MEANKRSQTGDIYEELSDDIIFLSDENETISDDESFGYSLLRGGAGKPRDEGEKVGEIQPKPHGSEMRQFLEGKIERWQSFYSYRGSISPAAFLGLLTSLEHTVKNLYFSDGVLDYICRKVLPEVREGHPHGQRKQVIQGLEVLKEQIIEELKTGRSFGKTYNPDYYLRALLTAVRYGLTEESLEQWTRLSSAKGFDGFVTRIRLTPEKAVNKSLPAAGIWMKIERGLEILDIEFRISLRKNIADQYPWLS